MFDSIEPGPICQWLKVPGSYLRVNKVVVHTMSICFRGAGRGERPSNGVVKEIAARNPIFGAAIMQRGRGRQKGSMVQGVTCLTRCDNSMLAKQKLLNVKIMTFV